MTNLGLGTVQLGLPYGNASDKPLMDELEAFSILQFAIDNGIKFFDTAQAYGDSERRLGLFGLADRGQSIQISTKVAKVPKDIWHKEKAYFSYVSQSCSHSRQLLRTAKLELLQFHQCEEEFLSAKTVQRVFVQLIESGICKEIGISVYKPEEAAICAEIGSISAIQMPVNLLDRRFINPVLLKKVASKGMRLLARSILLQGILIPHTPPPNVKKRPHLKKLQELLWLNQGTTDPLVSCLSFIFHELRTVLDTALIGVTSLDNLREVLEAIRQSQSYPERNNMKNINAAIEFANEHQLLDPSNWNC